MKQEQAEMIAVQALSFLASEPEIFHSFLAATGADVGDLRERAQDVHFLGAVLDFLMQEDAWVIQFAQGVGMAPQKIVEVRAALPGGQHYHWT